MYNKDLIQKKSIDLIKVLERSNKKLVFETGGSGDLNWWDFFFKFDFFDLFITLEWGTQW